MVRVGLVGCGTIGSQLALAVQRKYPAAARMSALHDVDCARAVALQRRLRSHPPIVSLPALVRQSDHARKQRTPLAQLFPCEAGEVDRGKATRRWGRVGFTGRRLTQMRT